MFAAFKTWLFSTFGLRYATAPTRPPHVNERSILAATDPDSESRLRSLREEELFFWQPTPLSWF